jgi:hypothetical protein
MEILQEEPSHAVNGKILGDRGVHRHDSAFDACEDLDGSSLVR